MNAEREMPLSRGAQVAAAVAIALLFAAVRLFHLVGRPSFFDELFTAWIASLPPDHMIEALASDSGPPLYYALLHLLSGGHATVLVARTLSLVAGALLLVAILRGRHLGAAAVVAALLLAVFAPHVYFSAEARAYALAGALAGGGCLALASWAAAERRRDLVVGTVLLVGAAASHYYGVLFFPIPLALGALAVRRRMILEGGLASAAAGLIFVPGFVLAARQPAESIAWMRLVGRAPGPLDPFAQLAFAADYPPAFIAPAPGWLHAFALLLTVAAVLMGLRSPEARRWGVMTLVPVAAVVLFGFAGKSVYFPLRFEAVIAGPFVCWLAVSLGAIRARSIRGALTVLLVVVGLVSSYISVMTALRRGPDGWREAAMFARRAVPGTVPLVASGYAYLELVAQKNGEWNPEVSGFPRSIEAHPGWIAPPAPADLTGETAALPPTPFVWVGARGSAELRALQSRYVLRPLRASRDVVVAEAVSAR